MNDRYAVAADGRTVPAEHEFPQWAASRRVVPVVRKFLADSMTPVGLYQALTAGRPGTFLLESAENGRSWSRFSFVGVRSGAMLTEQNGQACWLGDVPVLTHRTTPANDGGLALGQALVAAAGLLETD